MNLLVKWFNAFMGKAQTSVTFPDKDPTDYTLTQSSTGWNSDVRYCTKCMRSTGHEEYMSDICNGCGSFNTQSRYGRSYRRIVIGGVWKYQIKYRNGHEEIRDEWYK